MQRVKISEIGFQNLPHVTNRREDYSFCSYKDYKRGMDHRNEGTAGNEKGTRQGNPGMNWSKITENPCELCNLPYGL